MLSEKAMGAECLLEAEGRSICLRGCASGSSDAEPSFQCAEVLQPFLRWKSSSVALCFVLKFSLQPLSLHFRSS